MLIVFSRPGSTRIICGVSFIHRKVINGEDLFGWFRKGRVFGQAVLVDRWEAIYVLHDELLSNRPLTNLEWIKQP